jgi:hypothetical protein
LERPETHNGRSISDVLISGTTIDVKNAMAANIIESLKKVTVGKSTGILLSEDNVRN